MNKLHFMNTVSWNKATAFHRKNGFWNPAQTGFSPPCGTEPVVVTRNWAVVTCKKCLKARGVNKK